MLDTPPSAQANPFAASGRFCRPNQPETLLSADVSPGRRSRQRTAPAENRTEAKSEPHPISTVNPYSWTDNVLLLL